MIILPVNGIIFCCSDMPVQAELQIFTYVTVQLSTIYSTTSTTGNQLCLARLPKMLSAVCMSNTSDLLSALQRILDIRFVPQVLETIKKQQVQGAAFEGIKSYV